MRTPEHRRRLEDTIAEASLPREELRPAAHGDAADPHASRPVGPEPEGVTPVGVGDHKLYVRGTGTVLEQTEKGGNERNELVSVTRTR